MGCTRELDNERKLTRSIRVEVRMAAKEVFKVYVSMRAIVRVRSIQHALTTTSNKKYNAFATHCF